MILPAALFYEKDSLEAKSETQHERNVPGLIKLQSAGTDLKFKEYLFQIKRKNIINKNYKANFGNPLQLNMRDTSRNEKTSFFFYLHKGFLI